MLRPYGHALLLAGIYAWRERDFFGGVLLGISIIDAQCFSKNLPVALSRRLRWGKLLIPQFIFRFV